MGRISNTIHMAKSSWAVLKADKELLVLPAMSALATLVVAATFLLPLVGRGEDFEGVDEATFNARSATGDPN